MKFQRVTSWYAPSGRGVVTMMLPAVGVVVTGVWMDVSSSIVLVAVVVLMIALVPKYLDARIAIRRIEALEALHRAETDAAGRVEIDIWLEAVGGVRRRLRPGIVVPSPRGPGEAQRSSPQSEPLSREGHTNSEA